MGTCQQIKTKSLNRPHSKKKKTIPYHEIITHRSYNIECSPSYSVEIQFFPAPDDGAPRSCVSSEGRWGGWVVGWLAA
ncbi:hypothetical protein AYI69_g7453 [Smittium culicis]|uniref:Uncharacterized protein n=1 Tax=Smittium culicis TaxID=133412 RepID=A0A1R1XRZ5_9FUNG|nr:hypothetical protein AYI69_g9985 [Smittium culicis]OMJ17374.1 hypothetical protein AYI69_g7453 [Smittium culicis]